VNSIEPDNFTINPKLKAKELRNKNLKKKKYDQKKKMAQQKKIFPFRIFIYCMLLQVTLIE